MVPESPRLRWLALVAAAFAVGGCAAPFGPPGPRPLPPPTTPPGNGEITADPAAGGVPDTQADPGRQPNQAAVALLGASREATAAGDYANAAATLERALAIDPNNAALWIELAEVRWRQGDRTQADSLARKALTLAGNDRAIAARAESLMSRR
jgi:hypothetical protein